jgi:hypothetical protein
VAEQRRPRLPPLPDRPERPRAILGTPEFAPSETRRPLPEAAEFWLRGQVVFLNTMAKGAGHRAPLNDGCIALLAVLTAAAKLGRYAHTQEELGRKLFGKSCVRAIRDRTERLERCGLIRVQPTYMPSSSGHPERDAHYYLFCLDGFEDEQAIAPGEDDAEAEYPHAVDDGDNPAAEAAEEVVPEPVGAAGPLTGNVCRDSSTTWAETKIRLLGQRLTDHRPNFVSC